MTGEARHDGAADDSRPPDNDGRAAAPGDSSASLRLQPEFVTRDDGRYHVAELLAFHDRPFVEAAFRAVLRRAPTPAESHETLSDLRNGRRAKIEIVRDLARSEEGARQRATERVAGLKGSPFSAGVRDLPVVGYLWRVAAAVFRLPALLRDQQRFEAYALAQQQQIVEHFDARQHDFARVVEAAELRLAGAGEAVELRLDDAAAALSLLSDALAEISARHAEEQSRLARQIADAAERAEEGQRRLLDAHALQLDGQQEFLVREQQAIVEAQKAALAAAEGRLRELLSAHRRELAELSERVRSLPAAAETARALSGEEV